MANTRNFVAIVFDGVVCRDDRPRSSVVVADCRVCTPVRTVNKCDDRV
ncbi:MAG: hypothetical protein FWH14_05740 [Oscillospiraceae bacterium]|nr:hypothetical protein [Oscillospiraceae bacterium]